MVHWLLFRTQVESEIVQDPSRVRNSLDLKKNVNKDILGGVGNLSFVSLIYFNQIKVILSEAILDE